MASIISQASLEQGLVSIRQLFLVLCRSLRSPSHFWVHLISKQLPLASQPLRSAQQATDTSRTLGKISIQMLGDAASPCLQTAKCLHNHRSAAAEGVNTWSVSPSTENKTR